MLISLKFFSIMSIIAGEKFRLLIIRFAIFLTRSIRCSKELPLKVYASLPKRFLTYDLPASRVSRSELSLAYCLNT